MEDPTGEKVRPRESKLTPRVTKQTPPSPSELAGYQDQEVPHCLSSGLHLTAKALPLKGRDPPAPRQGVSSEGEQPRRQHLPYTQLPGH